MQRTLALLAVLAGFVSAASAQQSWRTEFGIQGGFARGVLAGAGADPTDGITVPGFSLGNNAAGVYAIIPWSQKLAIETEIAASQFSLGAVGVASVIGLGVRGDYAVTKQFYVAAGGTLAYNNGLGNATQLGVQGGLGYRFRLSRTLNARLEGRTTFMGKADNAPPVNVYSVLFGVSTPTSGQAAQGSSPRPSNRAWRAQIGIAGGYADAHLIGVGSVTSLSFPGYGGALGNALGGFLSVLTAVTLPPTMFAIIPLGGKVAIEPGLDIQRFQTGSQTDFTGNLSVRFDYAVHGGWYGALGGNLHYIKTSGISAATRTGLNIGGGYRFPLVAGVTGRVETNYTWFRENTDLGLPPTNVFGLTFGAALPIK